MKSNMKIRKGLLLAITLLLVLIGLLLAAPIAADTASTDTIVGNEGEAAIQDIPSIPHQSHLGPNSIDITPASPTAVANCIPFGNNTIFSFTGFVYRNVPPFNLVPGNQFAFDLGRQNNVDTRRNIYFAIANKNPAPAVVSGGNVVSQGIHALGWTQVASDTQTPMNPRGNFVKDDYELIYTAEAPFSFPGGGLIVGFGGSPPGGYADTGCEQVLVSTTSNDSSGFFYSRFFSKPDQTLGILDNITGGSASHVGGIVIQSGQEVDIDIKPGSNPNSINCDNVNETITVAILTTDDFDATTVDHTTVSFEGADESHVDRRNGEPRRHEEDVDSDGDIDLVFHFRQGDTDLTCTSEEGALTGETFDGKAIVGNDSVRMVNTE